MFWYIYLCTHKLFVFTLKSETWYHLQIESALVDFENVYNCQNSLFRRSHRVSLWNDEVDLIFGSKHLEHNSFLPLFYLFVPLELEESKAMYQFHVSTLL